jgi:hypothetical protein
MEIAGDPRCGAVKLANHRGIEALLNGIGDLRPHESTFDVLRGLALAHRLREGNDVEARADRSDRAAARGVVGRGDQQTQRTVRARHEIA